MVAVKIKDGRCCNIFALEEDGKCEMLDFLNVIRDSNAREFAKLIKDIDRTADLGLIHNHERFMCVDGDIYKLRTPNNVQVLCFLEGRSIVVLTNGFMKEREHASAIGYARNLCLRYHNAKLQGYLTYKEDIL